MIQSNSASRASFGRTGSSALALMMAVLCLSPPSGAQIPTQTQITLCEGEGCSAADLRLQLTGTVGADNFGFSASAGFLDIGKPGSAPDTDASNRDVFADFVVGAPDASRVFIFLGGVGQTYELDEDDGRGVPVENDINNSVADFVLQGPEDAKFGFSVFVGPEGDLVIGAPDDNTVYVVPAKKLHRCAASPCDFSLGVPQSSGVIKLGPFEGEAGYSVAMGQVISDSVSPLQIIVGAPRAQGDRGVVYVVDNWESAVVEQGTTNLRRIRESWRSRGGSPFERAALQPSISTIVGPDIPLVRLGEFLAVADFFESEDSGLAQIAVGASGSNRIGANVPSLIGSVYVVAPIRDDVVTLTDPPGDRVWCARGESVQDLFGFSLASANLDGNGQFELAVGAPFADRFSDPPGDLPEAVNAGAVYVFSDSEVEPPGEGEEVTCINAGAATVQRIYGDLKWDQLGFAVAAGDVDDAAPGGIEADELVVSARWKDGTDSPGPGDEDLIDQGAAYVFKGQDLNGCNRPSNCATWIIRGGDFDPVSNTNTTGASDEIGFSLAVGDFNGNGLNDDVNVASFADLAITSVTHERAYLVSLQDTDAGTDSDDGDLRFRDIRDQDDDEDGYSDVGEDFNLDGLLGANESDPLVRNRDIGVKVLIPEPLPCDGMITVTVEVTNWSPKLTVLDPKLQITLPGAPFAYFPGSTKVVRPGSIIDVDDGSGDAFPFEEAARSLTKDGTSRDDDPLEPTTDENPGPAQKIQVQFQLQATLKLAFDADLAGGVFAEASLDPDQQELPYPHDGGISESNTDTQLVHLHLPDLVITKSSTDVDGGQLDPLDEIEYTIEVSNTGPEATQAASNVSVSDTIPANTKFVSATSSQGSVSGDSTVIADLGTIPVGQTATVTIRVEVDEDVANAELVSNSAIVSETCLENRVSDSTDTEDDDGIDQGNSTDGDDDDATDDLTTVRPEIVVDVEGDRTEAAVGDTVVYTYRLTTGSGNVRLSTVTLSDSWLECDLTTFQGDTNDDGLLDWAETDPGGVGETWAYTCNYVVPAGRAGEIVNVAIASGTAPAGDVVTDVDAFAFERINTAPVAADDEYSTLEDTVLSVLEPDGVLANDQDANLDNLTVEKLKDPEHGVLLLDLETGSFTYTPAADYNGPDSFTYRANDGTTISNTVTVTITVTAVNDPPVLGAIGPRSVSEGGSLTIPLAATDIETGDGLAFTATGLPGFCTLTDNTDRTGQIVCDPTFVDSGPYSITVTVTDNGTPTLNDTETFTLTVGEINRAPELAPIGARNVNEGAPLNIGLSATDLDAADALTFTAVGIPTFCSLASNANRTGEITCNPTFVDSGDYAITVTVTDNGTPNLNDFELFTLTVNEVNQVPVLAAIGPQSVNEGVPLNIALTATDLDAADTLTLTATGVPAFCTFTDNTDRTGAIVCNPTFVDSDDYSMTVTVTDNGSPNRNDSETFTLTVNEINRAPVLDPIGDKNVDEGDTLNIALSASDVDAADTLTITAPVLPGFCLFTDNGGGSGSIVCNPTFVDSGDHSITVTVTDNGSPNRNDSETFTVTVNEINRAPVLDPIGDKNVDEGDTLNIALSASDVDAADTLTITAPVLPGFCLFTDNGGGSGSIVCNPTFVDSGDHSVTVTVTDNGSPNRNGSETLTVTVNEINRAPVLDPIGDKNVDEGDTLNIALSASDVDAADTLTITAPVLPGFCLFTDNGGGSGSIVCNPTFVDSGDHSVTVTVTDNGSPNRNDSETLTVTVNEINRAPVLDPIGDKNVDEGDTLNIALSASDVDAADTLTITAPVLPGFCLFTDNGGGSGSIVCNPTFVDSGDHSVTVTVTDNGSPNRNDSETLTVTVNEINRAPVLDPIGDKNVDEGDTLNIPLSATDPDVDDALGFSANGLPSFCLITDNGDRTGAIVCNPTATDSGAYPITIAVTDDNLDAVETITVTVNDTLP